jgi:hypothetical protein
MRVYYRPDAAPPRMRTRERIELYFPCPSLSLESLFKPNMGALGMDIAFILARKTIIDIKKKSNFMF